MNALVDKLATSLIEVRDQFEASTSIVAAFIGSLIGVSFSLAIVVILGKFIGRSFPWVPLILGVIVSIATLYTAIEVFLAISMYRHSTGEASRRAVPYVLAAKVIEFLCFIAAALILLHAL